MDRRAVEELMSTCTNVYRRMATLYLPGQTQAVLWRPTSKNPQAYSDLWDFSQMNLQQQPEAVLQLLPWVICWWLVSTAQVYAIGISTSMFYRGWKLGDVALWTSLRANQVAQRSLRRERKLLSYLLKGTLARNLTTCFFLVRSHTLYFYKTFSNHCIRQIRMCFSEIKQNRNTF